MNFFLLFKVCKLPKFQFIFGALPPYRLAVIVLLLFFILSIYFMLLLIGLVDFKEDKKNFNDGEHSRVPLE